MCRFATPPRVKRGETKNEMSYFESLAGTQVLEESNLHNTGNLTKGVEKMLSEGLPKDIISTTNSKI